MQHILPPINGTPCIVGLWSKNPGRIQGIIKKNPASQTLPKPIISTSPIDQQPQLFALYTTMIYPIFKEQLIVETSMDLN